TLRVLPKAVRHSRPRVEHGQFAYRLDQWFAIFVEYDGFHSRNCGVEAAGLDWAKDRAAEQAAGDFGAARIVDDRAAALTNFVEKPYVCFGVPYFTGGAQNPQRRQIMAMDRFRP